MQLDLALQSCSENGASGSEDLVATMLALINSTETADAAADPGAADEAQRVHRRALARRALAAAIGAERRLARLGEQVMRLEALAVTDPLTGLLNRRGFERELERVLATARRHGDRGVLLFVDLDGFKPVNDHFGHAAGDAVLKRVARVLTDAVRRTDTVARLGGDEFAIILDRADPDGGSRRAAMLERQLNAAVVVWEGQPIQIRGSFGVRAFDGHDEAGVMLAAADDAMYARKRDRSHMLAALRAA